MDAPTVADVIPDIHPAATHAVGDCITGTAMDDDLSLIHGISRCMVCIPVNDDRRAAHEHGQVATRNSIYRDGHIIAPDPVTDEPLPEHVVDNDLLCPAAIAARICWLRGV